MIAVGVLLPVDEMVGTERSLSEKLGIGVRQCGAGRRRTTWGESHTGLV